MRPKAIRSLAIVLATSGLGLSTCAWAAGTTFVVCDVPRCTRPLRTVDYRAAIEQRIGTFEAASQIDRTLVPTHVNALLEAVRISYSAHYPLVLTPDIIWLAICQGFALHVDQNAEALRYRVVAHEGKECISITRTDFAKGAPNNPWPEVLAVFCDSMKTYLVTDLHSVLLPSFTTTSIVETTAFEIAFMDALDSYFEYEVLMICGVPEITLEGTPEDWSQLRENARRLRDFDLAWWIDPLIPVLDQFVLASEGHPDAAFWNRIYNYRADSGEPKVNGWILRLFPYVRAEGGSLERNPFLDLEPAPNAGIPLNDFPSGLSTVALTLIDALRVPRAEYPMELLAGFVGIFQDPGRWQLRPEIAWVVRDRPENETDQD